jgi:hypothetical protein
MGMTRDATRRVECFRPALFGLCLLFCLPGVAAAVPEVEKLDAPEIHDGRGASPGSADTEAKKQALTLAFIMLASIIFGGTILLILVVLWGNRARRLARSPLPEVADRDELWFLKPKKGRNVSEAGDDTPDRIEP